MLDFLKDNYLIILAIYFLIKPLLQKTKPKQEENKNQPEYSPESKNPEPQSFSDMMKELSQSMQNNKKQTTTPQPLTIPTTTQKDTDLKKIFAKNTTEREKISFEPYKIDEAPRNYESPYAKKPINNKTEKQKSKLIPYLKKRSIVDTLSHPETIREVFIFNEIIQRKYH